MLVALAPTVSMSGRAKPLLSRRADLSERSVISYHKIKQYNRALERTLQRLEQDTQNNLLAQNIAAKRIKDEWELKQAAVAASFATRKQSCDSPIPSRTSEESNDGQQEWDKASVSPRQGVPRQIRSGSLGTLQPTTCTTTAIAPSNRKAFEVAVGASDAGPEQAKRHHPQQSSLYGSPVVICKHKRTGSLQGGEQFSLASARSIGDRRPSAPVNYLSSGNKKRLVPVRRLASDEVLGRLRMPPTISVTKEPDPIAAANEDSESVAAESIATTTTNGRCNAWESKSSSPLLSPSQLPRFPGSPTLTQHSLASFSTQSMSSLPPSSPGPHRLGVTCEDECSTITGSLIPIKTREGPVTGLLGRRVSSGCVPLSALRGSQTTRKEDLLEAARIMNFGPDSSKSHNPAMFKKFYSHIPLARRVSDSSRDDFSPKFPQRRPNDW